jgi:mevalonate pyrophosphate decarboxylase
MLISAIQSTGLFMLTENPEHADATLRGSGDDLIFTEEHNSSDSIGVHANAGSGSSSRSLNSGVSSNATTGIGVTDSENSKSQERHHEATGSVRLVSKDGDVIWSTTQESNGGKFRSAMADVADKIVRQLADETRKMRDLAAAARDSRPRVDDATAPVAAAPPKQ